MIAFSNIEPDWHFIAFHEHLAKEMLRLSNELNIPAKVLDADKCNYNYESARLDHDEHHRVMQRLLEKIRASHV